MGIGIDLGGTTIKGGIVNSQGKILLERFIKTESHRGYSKLLNDLLTLIKELLSYAPDEQLIGIGIPGILSWDGAIVVSCPNLRWKNVTLKKDLEARLTQEVNLVNDATAAGIAEAAFGSTLGKTSSMMITLGTGVGGGLILNGRIISGAHGVATEVGHMLMEKNFYSCGCGKNGCLETFASATALIRYCKMQMEHGVESSLTTEKMLDGKIIIDAAKAGDPLALEAVNRLARYLGWAIANISDIVDPEIYAIGGGLSYAGNFLLEKIRMETLKRLTYPQNAVPEIVLATFRNEAGIIGAANLKRFI
ncbi:ROK family protein [Acetobacterium tundrae]|uniref:ROK family protein n=1 Tax=Acetobacterium tundrae TaxID=132932 RepID=A0ABR6WGG7_9FIRM|nr:ROK family protein [Acetobacterium tundrae]MBC3795590.1 ROK family protein [Acetobacterium tundrae]